MKWIKNLWTFGVLQALSCVFPAVIFTALLVTRHLDGFGIPRYDLLLIVCLAAQAVMLWTRLETIDELKVICLFHVIGLAMEIFKVNVGSWSYPEPAYTKVFGVPLYSGFMYASVASYICQAWRRLALELSGWPSRNWAVAISAAIYLNFYAHHYIWDFRWVLTGLLFVVFWKTRVRFRLNRDTYTMPMVLSFFLIGFFVWIAENISTLLGAWTYPDQAGGWRPVHPGKISSWFLLVVVSVVIVAQLKLVKQARTPRNPPERADRTAHGNGGGTDIGS